MVSNVQSYNRKVTQGTLRNRKFCKFISPAVFEPVSAALLLLETAVIASVWVIIQLEAFLTPLLATVLQAIDRTIQSVLP